MLCEQCNTSLDVRQQECLFSYIERIMLPIVCKFSSYMDNADNFDVSRSHQYSKAT